MLIVAAVWFLLPMFVMIVTSVKTLGEIRAGNLRALVVAREATTFVVHRIGWIADWADVSAQVTGKALP